MCKNKILRKVDIFVIRPQEAEWFHLGVQNGENIPLKFLHNIIRSVFLVFQIAEMKQESFCWLYQRQVNHNILHNCNNGVPLMKTLKEKRSFLLLFPRWYCILKNIKSIRELVMFKITDVKLGHLYQFPTYVAQGWTNLWQYTDNKAVCFIMIITILAVKFEREVSGLDLNTRTSFVIMGHILS